MLEVALGVQPEVLRRRIVSVEAVVLDKTGELRARDRGLPRLDGIEDGERPETLVRRPGRGAVRGFRRRLPVERRLDRGGEPVPQCDVLRFLSRVLAIAGGGRGIRHGDSSILAQSSISLLRS